MTVLNNICLALLIIGGLNWGLIGLFGFNLVAAIFGTTWFTNLIYIVVGLAALYSLYLFKPITEGTRRKRHHDTHHTTAGEPRR